MSTTIDANVAAATRRLSHFINRKAAQQQRRMLEAWRKPAMSTTTPTALEIERVRTEAQKAAWEFDTLNEACPYPFATVKGVIFKEAFLTAQAEQRAAITPVKASKGSQA